MVVDMWNKVPDVIDDTKENLYLFFGEMLIWKVDQFLCNVLSWSVVSILDNHTKEFNIIYGNDAFLGW